MENYEFFGKNRSRGETEHKTDSRQEEVKKAKKKETKNKSGGSGGRPTTWNE